MPGRARGLGAVRVTIVVLTGANGSSPRCRARGRGGQLVTELWIVVSVATIMWCGGADGRPEHAEFRHGGARPLLPRKGGRLVGRSGAPLPLGVCAVERRGLLKDWVGRRAEPQATNGGPGFPGGSTSPAVYIIVTARRCIYVYVASGGSARLRHASSHSTSTPGGCRKTVSSWRRRDVTAATTSRARARRAMPWAHGAAALQAVRFQPVVDEGRSARSSGRSRRSRSAPAARGRAP